MVVFNCTICKGIIVFGWDDDIIKNTCVCLDNPVNNQFIDFMKNKD